MIRSKSDLIDYACELLKSHDAQAVKDAFNDGEFLASLDFVDVDEKDQQAWIEDVYWNL